jgi:hypothetical protein
MTALENFAQLAAKYSEDPRNRLAFHVGMLEAHIRKQEEIAQQLFHLIGILEQENRQLTLEINQEQS